MKFPVQAFLKLFLPGLMFVGGCAVKADNIIDRDDDDDEWIDFDDTESESTPDDGSDDPADKNDSDSNTQNKDDTDNFVDSELKGDTGLAQDSESESPFDTTAVQDSATAVDTDPPLSGDTAVDSETVTDSDPHGGSDIDTVTDTVNDTLNDTGTADTAGDTESVASDDTGTLTDSDSIELPDTGTGETDTATASETSSSDTSDTETDSATSDSATVDTETETETATETETETTSDTETDGGKEIYVTYSNIWQGHGWTTTGSAAGGVISTDVDEGYYELGTDSLCITGSTAADYNSQGGIGFNLDQAQGAAGEEAALWVPAPSYTRLAYEIVTNTSLRLEIVNLDDTAETSYCTVLSGTGTLSGSLNLTEFRTNCWGSSNNVYYTTTTGLLRIAIYVPGQESGAIDYDFCINALYPE